jgi:hypothetical protein
MSSEGPLSMEQELLVRITWSWNWPHHLNNETCDKGEKPALNPLTKYKTNICFNYWKLETYTAETVYSYLHLFFSGTLTNI